MALDPMDVEFEYDGFEYCFKIPENEVNVHKALDSLEYYKRTLYKVGGFNFAL